MQTNFTLLSLLDIYKNMHCIHTTPTSQKDHLIQMLPPKEADLNACRRCSWVNNDPIYIQYHDTEWGVPIYNERLLFEFLILGGMQAGLSWLAILKRRNNYRTCFDHFDADLISKYDEAKVNLLLTNPGIIRNKLKVRAVISNAKAFLEVKKEWGDFSKYLWHFVGGSPLQNHWKNLKQIPTTTLISDVMSKDLKKRGFKFVGSTICYAFMQSVGMVNDHTIDCFKRLAPPSFRERI